MNNARVLFGVFVLGCLFLVGTALAQFGGTYPSGMAGPAGSPGATGSPGSASTPFPGPYLAGMTQNWTGGTTNTIGVPSAAASPGLFIAHVVAQSTLSATPCAVASPTTITWTEGGKINGGSTNNEIVCTAPIPSSPPSTIVWKDATGIFVPALYVVLKASGSPTVDQSAGQLLATNACPPINASLITDTKTNEMVLLGLDNVTANGASYFISDLVGLTNFNVTNPPNVTLYQSVHTSFNTATRMENTFIFHETTGAVWPGAQPCNAAIATSANGAALMTSVY